MINYHEKIYQIAFSLIKGIGPSGYRLIADEFENVGDIYQLSDEALKPFISKKSIREDVLNRTHFERATKEYNYCQENGIDILFYKESRYPQRLNFFDNLPCILFYRGNANLNAKRVVSIVGTRNPSEYGKIQCSKIVKALKAHDALIVSGLAYGIDITAHKSSLDNHLNTIGVMASGQSKIYPSDHLPVANKMLEAGGLLTEFLHDEEVIREMFPMRNRIVAAMSDVVIVVESAQRGGSLITAEFANEYGKDVFAVPGRPDDPVSKGCNLLIKSHKASMYESIKDLQYITRWNTEKIVVQTSLFKDLSNSERELVELVNKLGECHIDRIQKELKITAGELAIMLLNVELMGIIKSIPGKRYICI